ncbi:MAG: Flp pilus assembly complex ATPase component TadA [Anaerolineae bacterium]|nr:Flp pilus assembly complex ATPase component TadA [Anaerolineae bacterium]
MAVTEQVAVKKKRILIVDDDPGMCETLADVLEDKGYIVGTAQDGRTAIEKMKEGQYDIIFIDIMMPGMNGVETLQGIKAVNPDATTIIMTGHSQLEGLVSEALWAGVDGVLYKPFDVEAVLKIIESQQKDVSMPVIDLKRYEVDPEALRLVPEEMARKYSLLPLRVENGYLIVAMADPTNIYAIEDLRARTSLEIKPLKASRADIEAALSVHYQNTIEIERQIERISPVAKEREGEVSRRLTAEIVAQTPIARAVELMIRQAVMDRASDIHLEPQETHLRVRYRIDGVLHDAMTLPLRVHASLLSRIKVLANLNIAERRRPQDGQFSVKVDNRTVDIRVATINTVHGEMAVLRVLDKSMSVLSLDELGFLPEMQELYEQIIHSPWGIILLAGPTGSGKTSTMYASINRLDRDEKKIITIEDPVEYRFEGISQVQVNRQAGITFASGLRAAMRLDPDIILVGEIRDQETARTAVQASLTGHLVFSSIHANDTVGSILRLIDLGVEPFLVTSSLLAVVSQRLVRRVCPHCRTTREGTEAEQLAYEQALGEKRTHFEYGAGCNFCAGTGYRGRIAVFEMLVMNDQIRRLILRNANSDEIREAAIASGMRTMLYDGMMKVKQGITTPSEVLRNVFALH